MNKNQLQSMQDKQIDQLADLAWTLYCQLIDGEDITTTKTAINQVIEEQIVTVCDYNNQYDLSYQLYLRIQLQFNFVENIYNVICEDEDNNEAKLTTQFFQS
jgi:hypothetical protein